MVIKAEAISPRLLKSWPLQEQVYLSSSLRAEASSCCEVECHLQEK